MADLTLAEFVLARLAEEAEAATDATPGPWAAVDPNRVWGDDMDTQLVGGGKILATLRSEYRGYLNGLHITRWDPARVLAEVEHKRRILARHTTEPGWTVEDDDDNEIPACTGCGDMTNPWPCRQLRELAEIWAGHADYRAEWAPPAPHGGGWAPAP